MKLDENGVHGRIVDDGKALELRGANGDLLFMLAAPAHSIFYLLTRHIAAGMCPVVSFEASHVINGWPDWFYEIDFHTQTMTRLNPWK